MCSAVGYRRILRILCIEYCLLFLYIYVFIWLNWWWVVRDGLWVSFGVGQWVVTHCLVRSLLTPTDHLHLWDFYALGFLFSSIYSLLTCFTVTFRAHVILPHHIVRIRLVIIKFSRCVWDEFTAAEARFYELAVLRYARSSCRFSWRYLRSQTW